jgi:3-hydroxybutyryl-CoA dehydrogenase
MGRRLGCVFTIFNLDGNLVSMIAESIGFVAQRVLAMVINLGCDMR